MLIQPFLKGITYFLAAQNQALRQSPQHPPIKPTRTDTVLCMEPMSEDDLMQRGLARGMIPVQFGQMVGHSSHQLLRDSAIGWCDCQNAPLSLRLKLHNQMVATLVQRANPKPLMVTDLGSGRILQSLLLTEALVQAGEKKLTVNLIDPFFPETICGEYHGRERLCESATLCSLIDPSHIGDSVATVSTQVQEGFATSIREYLTNVVDLMDHSGANIKVNIYNSERAIPPNQNGEYDQVALLVDPGEPHLSTFRRAHFIGFGSKDAIPHSEQVLCFLRSSLEGNSSTIPAANEGILYIQTDEMGFADSRVMQTLKTVQQQPSTTKYLLNALTTTCGEAHYYEDPIKSFAQLAQRNHIQYRYQLAFGEIKTQQRLVQEQSLTTDELLKSGQSLLAKALSYRYDKVTLALMPDPV